MNTSQKLRHANKPAIRYLFNQYDILIFEVGYVTVRT